VTLFQDQNKKYNFYHFLNRTGRCGEIINTTAPWQHFLTEFWTI